MSPYWSAPLAVAATGVYTMVGGLSAVMATDVALTAVFVVGGAMGAALVAHRVGGWTGVRDTMLDAGRDRFTHLYRPADDAELPGIGILLGQLVSSTWYWCLDHEMAQRALAARGLPHARLGVATAALLKTLPAFIIVFPGMAARALHERCISGADSSDDSVWCFPDLSRADAADASYPLLVLREFPPGARGLMVASFLCAMMSSLASVFNASSTVFTFDVYAPAREAAAQWRRMSGRRGTRGAVELATAARRRDDGGAEGAERAPLRRAGEEESLASDATAVADAMVTDNRDQDRLVAVGRAATAAVVLVSLAWLPVVRGQRGHLYLLAQAATLHLAPSVVAVYLLGVFWHRANDRGAIAGLLLGSLAGALRLALSLSARSRCAALEHVTTDGRLALDLSWSSPISDVLCCLHFQYWCLFQTLFTFAVTVVASFLLGPPPPPCRLDGTTIDVAIWIGGLFPGRGSRGGDAKPFAGTSEGGGAESSRQATTAPTPDADPAVNNRWGRLSDPDAARWGRDSSSDGCSRAERPRRFGRVAATGASSWHGSGREERIAPPRPRRTHSILCPTGLIEHVSRGGATDTTPARVVRTATLSLVPVAGASSSSADDKDDDNDRSSLRPPRTPTSPHPEPRLAVVRNDARPPVPPPPRPQSPLPLPPPPPPQPSGTLADEGVEERGCEAPPRPRGLTSARRSLEICAVADSGYIRQSVTSSQRVTRRERDLLAPKPASATAATVPGGVVAAAALVASAAVATSMSGLIVQFW